MARDRNIGTRLAARRRLLQAGAGLYLIGSATACDLLSTEPSQGGNSAGRQAGQMPKQAPMLADLVAAGDLPSLAERLPDRPAVVEPVERRGLYGGTWTSAILGAADTSMLYRTIGYDQLVTWDRDFTEAVPNIAEHVETVDNGRTFVFHLRAGMRWSDGEKFTADDIIFAYDDVLSNEELSPVVPSWLAPGGKPAVAEKIDDTTVSFSFESPFGWFLLKLATPDGEPLTSHPRHYLEKFHPKYASGAESLAKDSGYADWVSFFQAKADRWNHTELPTLSAWRITRALGDGARVDAERNPYYWKTDPEGSQLPYIDYVHFEVIDDEEVMLLKASNGEFSMHDRYFNTASNQPVVAQGREAADYRFFEKGSLPNEMVISLNLTHKDLFLREVFNKKEFRIGLSLAINRHELIDRAFQRQGRPWQAAPRPGSPLADEEMGTQFTEYDPELANDYLDRAGYAARDGDGYRQAPDGRRISFKLDVAGAVLQSWESAAELIIDYWGDVGVEARLNLLDRSLFFERKDFNQNDSHVWWVGGDGNTMVGAMLAPDFYVPTSPFYGTAWARWYDDAGEPMQEPPDSVKRQLELFDRAKAAADDDDRMDAFEQVLLEAKDQYYCIGIVMRPEEYGIVRNNFHNVPEPMGETWEGVTPGRSRPEQYFIEEA